MGGIQSVSALPDDPTFSQFDNKYDVASYKRICAEFGVDPSSDFLFTRGANHGLGDVYIWITNIGSKNSGAKYPDHDKFSDEGGTASKDNLIQYIEPEDSAYAQADWFCPNGTEGLTQADAIRQPDLAKSVQRYQLAIDEAKVPLNLAVCPGAWLMPARMVINTESVVGYNNQLKQAVGGMKVGVNNDVNTSTIKAALKLMAGGPSKTSKSVLVTETARKPGSCEEALNNKTYRVMAVQEILRPARTEKILGALKAERAVKRITFDRTEANPEETLYVLVPKLNENEVIVPGSLALRFNIDLSGHVNNFLVDNVSRSLVDKFVVKYQGTVVQDTVGYDIYKIFEDFFLSQEERYDRVPEGIQSEDLNKIRSNAGDKKTSGVDAEKKLNELYGNKYRTRLEHQILTDHGAFYPQALYNDLVFELKLAAAEHVVRGSDPTKLKYKRTNIQLEYKMIRSKEIADEAFSSYASGKEFAYDHIQRDKVVTFAKGSDTRLNLRVNPQRRSLKGILLLFVEQYAKDARSSEKYINPDLTKVSVTVNGSPNMLYNNGIEGMDIWEEVKRFYMKEKNKTQHMTMQKFYTEDKYGLLIDLRSMADHSMHGSGTRFVNTKDGVQLELERKASGSANTLIILDDCAASKDVKERTGELVNLAFSARHAGLSVWVLPQKMTA
ncbi:hypothetical protein ACROYT_G040507 [Oculina patagonica]